MSTEDPNPNQTSRHVESFEQTLRNLLHTQFQSQKEQLHANTNQQEEQQSIKSTEEQLETMLEEYAVNVIKSIKNMHYRLLEVVHEEDAQLAHSKVKEEFDALNSALITNSLHNKVESALSHKNIDLKSINTPHKSSSEDAEQTLQAQSQEKVSHFQQYGLGQHLEQTSFWELLRTQAKEEIEKEQCVQQLYTQYILQHSTIKQALAYLVSSKISTPEFSFEQWYDISLDLLDRHESIAEFFEQDINAIVSKDPAAESHVDCILNYNGMQALLFYRFAHQLYLDGRKSVARFIQQRMSQIFSIDIHPACVIGKGVMIDHGAGLVIGETAVIGDGCQIMHNVTLGGNYKQGQSRDRHPKLGNNVFIGSNVVILGNIKIGNEVKIGAGSVVLIDLPERCTAVGVPAKIIPQKQ